MSLTLKHGPWFTWEGQVHAPSAGEHKKPEQGSLGHWGAGLLDGKAVTEEGTKNRKSNIKTRRKVAQDNVGWPVRTQSCPAGQA